MAHLSENSRRLTIEHRIIMNPETLLTLTQKFNDVLVIKLPSYDEVEHHHRLKNVDELIANAINNLGSKATVVIIGEVIDLVTVHDAVTPKLQYQHWIAIKRKTLRNDDPQTLPGYHFGATIYTKYRSSLKHTKTRIQYTYCPACDKTTKDYGGKKHTYHEYGTLISDIWRDISCDLEDNIDPIVNRLADLFGVEPYKNLLEIDLSHLVHQRQPVHPQPPSIPLHPNGQRLNSQLIHGDCLEEIRNLPDNSVDFIFTDPPYNLGKKYRNYSDDMAITEYFEWCDEWIEALVRILKPGHTLALLNIPLWSVRHFHTLEKLLTFQNWIAWDALSFPVRRIMPAHYAILCFSKGTPRPLPGLVDEAGTTETPYTPEPFRSLQPLAEDFCLRSTCIKQRKQNQIDDRGPLTDLWWDIHRIKHNTRRVDHPTQLPPQLMHRLISLFTEPDEVVLDCFNGSGTTTLAAHQLGRRYIGIENDNTYYDLMCTRHSEVEAGFDPFRKEQRDLTAKNSPVERLPKIKYEVPKKTLQLEVKRVAALLDRLPDREDMIKYGKYPIRYYDEYFISWGEVRAAARTTGMTEDRVKPDDQTTS